MVAMVAMDDIIDKSILYIALYSALMLVICGSVLACLILFRKDPFDFVGPRVWALIAIALTSGLAILGLALAKWAIRVVT